MPKSGRALIILESGGGANIEAALVGAGFQVERADSTETVRVCFKKHPIELVVSGLTPGGRTAGQLLNELTRDGLFHPEQMAWVMVSSELAREQRERFVRSGILDFIEGNVDSSRVGAVLEQIRNRRRNPLREISDLVSGITGVTLNDSKNYLVEKRLTRRMLDLGIKTTAEYLVYFRTNRELEIPHLVSQLTTHTTEFFRDPGHFDALVNEHIPLLRRKGGVFRIWSAACSTGEEVYSLAIAFLEANKRYPGEKWDIRIMGTDVDEHTVKTASEGIYPANSVKKIHPALVSAYFDQGSGEISNLYRIKETVWKLCEFRQVNLLANSYPFKFFDVIFCRNVFIYFSTEEVHRAARQLGEHLGPNGRLYIGASEILHGDSIGLKPAGKAIYERIPSAGIQTASDPVRVSRPPLKKVLVVDDSKTIQVLLKRILTPQYGFEVVGAVNNPIEADRFLKSHSVDVMTLDIHMPEMDGVTYLQKLRHEDHPPIVMLSSIDEKEAIEVFKCLELGADDYLEKPSHGSLETKAEAIRTALRTAAHSGARRRIQSESGAGTSRDEGASVQYLSNGRTKDLILIGASTGGIEAIRKILPRFPVNGPPVLIVQHIPPLFSKLFAQRLNEICKIKVSEAMDEEILKPGHAYIAPGGKQMGIASLSSGLQVRLEKGTGDELHAPSVDHLFHSVARLMKNADLRVSAAILTGMGRDGAQGMKRVLDLGAHTVAQDESSCVVYGMPKSAVELHAAAEICPLESVPYHLFQGFGKKSKVA